MDSLMISAAGGIRARLESLDLLANNLANASTTGYKADREAYSLYASEESKAADDSPAPLPLIQSRWSDLRQGVLVTTDNPLDLALVGPGNFVVDGPNGPLYTRNGSFRLQKDGRLTTADGYELSTVEPRRIRANPLRSIEIATDGAVRQDGQVLGHLQIAGAVGPEALEKRAGAYFSLSSPTPVPAGPATEVRQGMLEASNTNPAESAIRLISVLRQFESLQRAVQLGSEMNKHAVEEVARPGS